MKWLLGKIAMWMLEDAKSLVLFVAGWRRLQRPGKLYWHPNFKNSYPREFAVEIAEKFLRG